MTRPTYDQCLGALAVAFIVCLIVCLILGTVAVGIEFARAYL